MKVLPRLAPASRTTRQFIISAFEADARVRAFHTQADSSRIKVIFQNATTQVRLSLEEGVARQLSQYLRERLLSARRSSHHRHPVGRPVDEAFSVDFKDGRTFASVTGGLDLELTLSNTSHFVRLMLAPNVAGYVLEDLDELLPRFEELRQSGGGG